MTMKIIMMTGMIGYGNRFGVSYPSYCRFYFYFCFFNGNIRLQTTKVDVERWTCRLMKYCADVAYSALVKILGDTDSC